MRNFLALSGALIANGFSSRLAHRGAVGATIVGRVIIVWVQIAIWQALLVSGSVEGITLRDMITYTVLTSITVNAFRWQRMLTQADVTLRSGDISSILLRPVAYPFTLFCEMLADAAFQFVFVALPVVLLTVPFQGLVLPASVAHAGAAFVSLGVTALMAFLIAYVGVLTAFWILTTFAVEWVLYALVVVLAGNVVPIWFFPETWQRWALWTPFAYLNYHPAALYLGKTAAGDIGVTLGVGILWVVVLGLFSGWLWRRAVQRVVIQGG